MPIFTILALVLRLGEEEPGVDELMGQYFFHIFECPILQERLAQPDFARVALACTLIIVGFKCDACTQFHSIRPLQVHFPCKIAAKELLVVVLE